MTAFLIVNSKLTKPELFQNYVIAAEESLKLYQGEYHLGGSFNTLLEGQHDKTRTVIFKFPSSEHAKTWYNGKEYQGVKHLREGTGEFDFVLIDSF
ncbi:DUF1330 domain-containing protein [Gammaproteobacteria bacterium]|jgi:uncharacterized protein (DUF1330 family)|nr:DUF1330 domain-containing protein [Gammaproteobacteria bacterium]